MKIKKIVSVLLCCITIAAMFSLAACGDKGTYVDAFNAYMKAQDDLDTQKVISLLPPDMYNYIYNIYDNSERAEYSDAEIKEIINERYTTMLANTDFARFDINTDLKDGYSYNYKIVEEYDASSKEVNEFNAYVNEKLGFKNKAQDIVLIKYQYSILKNGEVMDPFSEVYSFGICLKYDGKWYYAEANMNNERMWVERNGLNVYDCVQWIYDWF